MTSIRNDVTLRRIVTADVTVIGAGPAGLATAMLFADAGLDVVVVEADGQEPPTSPETAWTDWARPGVSQFHQSHGLLPRGLQLLETHWPAVVAQLRRLGAHPFNLADSPPASIPDWAAEPADARFDSLAARRPLYELAFALAASETPKLEVRRGARVTGLLTGPEAVNGAPHVTGLETDRGGTIEAGLVIDAGGRRSPMPALLEEIGAQRPPREVGDFRFVYYTRYYRRTHDQFPQPYVLSRFLSGSVSIGTFPADDGTWSVTLYGTSSDRALRSAKDPDTFERVIRAHPDRSDFVDGEPISPVMVMAGVADRESRIHVDGSPVATGWVPVADAWACTNPILGRGITMGLIHAAELAPALSATLDAPAKMADAWETVTCEHVRPWYLETRDIDRSRSQEMEAVRTGRIPTHGCGMTPAERAWTVAAITDQQAYRAQLEIASMLTPSAEVFSRPDLRKVIADAAEHPPPVPVLDIPDREELERILAS